ncbi:MAG TPA: hypothetical protein VN673_19125 [Clostridia bacterium]|nr:hypothetical protein [Clostridia bacterium]
MDRLMWDMKRIRFIAILTLGAFALALAVIVFSTPPPRPHTLSLRVLRAGKSAAGSAEISVVISNASENIVMCENGPPLYLVYLEKNAWKTNYTNRSVTGAMLLRPRSVVAPIAITQAVPESADIRTVRVGLSFVSFSWRGKLGLAISKVPFLKPLSGLLFRLDESKRSGIEWSEPVATF